MPECGQLAVFGKALNGFTLPNRCVAFHVVHHIRLQNKKTAIDPSAIALGLFLERCDAVIALGQVKGADPVKWRHGQ